MYHILIPVSHTTYPPTEAKMPQALDASAYVFQGVWTNWSKKGVLGVTLTLSPANAAVLVAILALFVQMTGSQLWTVIQFTFHQHRASEVPKDALYHQQQAVLRNNPSDLNTLRQLFQHPAGHNIEWHAVLSLLNSVGTVQETHKGHIRATIGEDAETFDPQRHKDIDADQLTNLRRLLRKAGFGPGDESA